ncbi:MULTISPECIES: hypothetical protein [Cyanophyceae]|uniref:hypothetical protein n=1 Tax=Cyanophyceae TaxID=3028117 RepID=UPI001689551E|nr:hypothetical protein [Nodosilinea sp. FACHB-141]MBD2115139.1 hypothetical protein [Nodosilinea sp. FACHB-141]
MRLWLRWPLPLVQRPWQHQTIKDRLRPLGVPKYQAGAFSDRLIGGNFLVIVDGS